MTPRNSSSSYKKGNDEVDINQIVPCILHKKHKVVKLIREHLENVNQEGLFTNLPGNDEDTSQVEFIPRLAAAAPYRQGEEVDMNSSDRSCGNLLLKILFILLLLLGLILLIIWISSGPLSNTIPHTPILSSAFIRTECLCSLEKKYLLRWSKPEYFE